MNELEKQIQDITNKINEIDEKLERIEIDKKEREEGTPLGMISIVNGNIKIELLLDEKLFDEENVKELERIATDIQMLVLKIQDKLNKGEDK